MAKDTLSRARSLMGMMSVEELKRLRDDATKLLRMYEEGGVLAGSGSIELKYIRRPRRNFETGELEMVYHGPYCYIRRYLISANGRISYATVGYYGAAGADAVAAGHGAALLKAHNEGGEGEGDDLLAKLGYEPPERRDVLNKPPRDKPAQMLGGENIDLDTLTTHPIFKYMQQHAPAVAQELQRALLHHQRETSFYQFANEHRWKFRTPNKTIKRRRVTARRRMEGHPPLRVPHGKRKPD